MVRIQFALGRLTPIGVLGDASPASPTTLTTLYVMPTTLLFLVLVHERHVVFEPLRIVHHDGHPLRGFESP